MTSHEFQAKRVEAHGNLPDDFNFSDAILIYGGSFNPFHMAHYLFVSMLCAYFPNAEKWIVPTYSHAFDKRLMDYDRRIAVLDEALAHFPNTIVSRIERDLAKTPSYTVDVARAIRTLHPQKRLFIVGGADLLPTLPLWHEIDELQKIADFLIFPRQGCPTPNALPSGVHFVPSAPLPELSSTAIRDAIEHDQLETIRFWLPAASYRDLAKSTRGALLQ